MGCLKTTVNCLVAEIGEVFPEGWAVSGQPHRTYIYSAAWFQGGGRLRPQGGSELAIVSFHSPPFQVFLQRAPSITSGTPFLIQKNRGLQGTIPVAWAPSCVHVGALHPTCIARRRKEKQGR